ncbi:GNAT family N-acetyltransferase [Streptomyces sp. NPDC059176]|uniref:GNAT family N-acetyltransferase n=1 Tax=unclassified Streptomyces TaxID=2593676 RepID=UPI003673D8F4
MTTTLRPSGPLQRGADGATSRGYDVCVNGRPVGAVELSTDPALGPSAGVVRSLHIDEPDRRRGRGTVAALAAEEVLRGWGCDRVRASVPAEATAALRLSTALGYVEQSRNMLKELPVGPLPELPEGVRGRPMTEAEFQDWLDTAVDDYARAWTGRGMPTEQARAKSEADHREQLGDGLATRRTWMRVLEAAGTPVGHVWVGEREVRPGERGAYVYDVGVAARHRGRGHGRALMLLAERVARSDAAADLIGLHVFANNTPALRLYASLGYVTTRVNVAKQLL